jgi:hypothetical protein
MLERVFLYADLKPGDRIHKIIEEYIYPDLKDKGFKLKKSPLSLTRTLGQLEQTIHFQKNIHNSGNEMAAFDVSFHISFKSYKAWHLEKYNKSIMNEAVAWVKYGRDIPNWSNDFTSSLWYDLAQTDNVKIIDVLRNNMSKYGLKYLDSYYDFQTSINTIKEKNLFYQTPLVYDFCVFLNDKKQASEILTWFDNARLSGLSFNADILASVELRKKDISNWV